MIERATRTFITTFRATSLLYCDLISRSMIEIRSNYAAA
jgi:hypothetical protein